MRRKLAFAIAAAALAGFSLVPFLWFVSTSLKSPAEITAIPPHLWPSFTWEAYRAAWVERGLPRYLWNSALVASAATLVTLALAAPAAYAIARLRLGWTRLYLLLLLMVSMFPQIATAGPVWRLLRALGWLNTYQGLVAIYVALSLPLAVWILATYFRELPFEIEEAALVDGLSRGSVLWRIMLPLAAPGIFTAAILVFIFAWNEFFFGLLVMTAQARQTLAVGIALFPGEYTMPWGEIAAASTIATIPLALLAAFFQRRIIGGLFSGAVRG
jgi:multiple sugar transport system permease protein